MCTTLEASAAEAFQQTENTPKVVAAAAATSVGGLLEVQNFRFWSRATTSEQTSWVIHRPVQV